ncbi:caveolin-1-like isoform X2 [Ostrea edulis]|uniref:caveolin-1-like isoform X2 n=1 Tax=Ostrea edulis TaxID=37623 RepID=UPI0020953E6C|nr:caveolin-1-like isoform X2 [Ostrea edulis]
MDGLDLINRDPNNINDHLKTGFDDVLAETDGTHSLDCIWKVAYCFFHGCKAFWYNLCTLLCGFFIACFWGIEFAAIAFGHVWCITPCLRVGMIHCNLCQKTLGTWVNCCFAPCCEVFGLIFSNIKIEKR